MFQGIPQSSEKILSFTISHLGESFTIKVIDSLQFMPGSLSSIVENTKKEFPTPQAAFPNFFQHFWQYGWTIDMITRILKKNEFPYTALDSFAKLTKPIETMPLKEPFPHEQFGFHIWVDYLCCYLECDTLQLCDAFEHFVKKIYDAYGLFAFYYVGLPRLSWDCMLITIKDKFTPEILSDPNMVGYWANLLRGGWSYMGLRLAEYEEGSIIVYFDANNLYGWAMMNDLPYRDFRWMTQEELDALKADPYAFIEKCHEQHIMFSVMGDFIYPPEIHHYTSDLPLMPERACVDEEWLSDKQVELNIICRTRHNAKQPYLLQTQFNKYNYFVYGELLDFYLQQGIIIDNLYCGQVF